MDRKTPGLLPSKRLPGKGLSPLRRDGGGKLGVQHITHYGKASSDTGPASATRTAANPGRAGE